MRGRETARGGWDWTVTTTVAVAALFVWILLDGGCAYGSEAPPQAPPIQAPPVRKVTIPVGPSVTTAWYADRVEVYAYRGGVRYGFVLARDAGQDAIDRATADLFALLKQPAAGVPVQSPFHSGSAFDGIPAMTAPVSGGTVGVAGSWTVPAYSLRLPDPAPSAVRIGTSAASAARSGSTSDGCGTLG